MLAVWVVRGYFAFLFAFFLMSQAPHSVAADVGTVVLPESGTWTTENDGWIVKLTKTANRFEAELNCKLPSFTVESKFLCSGDLGTDGTIDTWCGDKRLVGKLPTLKFWSDSRNCPGTGPLTFDMPTRSPETAVTMRSPVAEPTSSLSAQIAELKDLHDKGLIDRGQFEQRREALLNRSFGNVPAAPEAIVRAVPAAVSHAPTPVPAAPATAQPETVGIDWGRYHALVIGIDNYRQLPKLRTAVNDATRIAELLQNDYGFAVTRLLNPTHKQLVDALDVMRETLRGDDNLLIYYAGHGWLDEAADRGYWLPVDAEPNRRSQWVSNATITDTLRTVLAKHVMVVADSCFSGTLTRDARISLPTADYWRRIASKAARVTLTSGGVEPVADSNGQGHSPFAAAFIQVLQENRGVMDGTSLFSAMRRPVMLNANQTPEYSDVRSAGHDGGDFVFVRR